MEVNYTKSWPAGNESGDNVRDIPCNNKTIKQNIPELSKHFRNKPLLTLLTGKKL